MDLFDLRQLKIFSALAETKSFTAAAEKLFLTQSAVSHSIKSLEGQLDCQLVERLGKTGETLLSHAEIILTQAETAMMEVTSLLRPGFGRLRVGAAHTACYYILPAVIREFRECFPNCEISIMPGDTAELVNMVDAGQVDVAISLRSSKAEHLNFQQLFEDRLACIYSPLSAPESLEFVTPKDLRREKLIVYAQRSLTTRMVEEHFRKHGVPTPQLLALGNMEAIKEFAKIGVGVGIIAPWIADKELGEKSLLIRELGPEPIQREWGIYSHSSRTLSIMEENFFGLSEMVCQEIAKKGQWNDAPADDEAKEK